MNIVIIGGGSVGASICKQLAKEGHNITIVDSHSDAITELSNTCDVGGIVGNGADISVLKKAGAENADLLIAVTSEDEINILCCAAAKKLGTRHTIARASNPEYADLMRFMRNEWGLSLMINPEYAAAKEIYRTLRFPSAAKIDTFCRGRVELAEYIVTESSSLCGKTLIELRSKLNMKFLVCGVLRNGTAHIPSGNFRIEVGDIICVTAPEDEISEFFKASGEYKQPVKNVIIVGGSRTTYYLQTLLQKSKINSTIIEKDKNLCRDLAETFSCTVICDDGSKQELLLEEGIQTADAFLAMKDVDEENAIISLYAKSLGVAKIITLIGNLSYIDFFKGAGLESIVSPKSSTTAQIVRYVRATSNTDASEMESLHSLLEGRAEAIEFSIKDNIDGLTNIPLKDIDLREGVLIACIVHNDKIIIPSGVDVISVSDTVIVVTAGGQMDNIKDILK